MDSGEMQRRWSELAEEAFTGMAEWRVQHPKATFREKEEAVDERLAAVRARMLGDAALASGATELGVASGEVRAVVGTGLEYLQRRREQIRYAEFELQGLPVCSGIVESANKLLVEERLKGPGMHWARNNVNPMLALRTIAFNDRWTEAWAEIVARLRAQHRVAANSRRSARTNGAKTATEVPMAVEAAGATVTKTIEVAADGPKEPQPAGTTKPALDHPWRRFRFGRSLQPQPAPDATGKIWRTPQDWAGVDRACSPLVKDQPVGGRTKQYRLRDLRGTSGARPREGATRGPGRALPLNRLT